MKKINETVSKMLDFPAVMEELTAVFGEMDPGFPNIERAFSEAAQGLVDEFGAPAQTFLTAKESEFCIEALSLCWSGFLLNYQCFQDPVHSLMLDCDFEVLHQENRLPSIPALGQFSKDAAALSSMLPAGSERLLPITEYYSYLQTNGYKLAHYYGFRLANRLLPYLVPGFVPDELLAWKYKSKMISGSEMNVDQLD